MHPGPREPRGPAPARTSSPSLAAGIWVAHERGEGDGDAVGKHRAQARREAAQAQSLERHVRWGGGMGPVWRARYPQLVLLYADTHTLTRLNTHIRYNSAYIYTATALARGTAVMSMSHIKCPTCQETVALLRSPWNDGPRCPDPALTPQSRWSQSRPCQCQLSSF